MRAPRLAVALALALGLGLTACSGDAEEPEEKQAASTTPQTPAAVGLAVAAPEVGTIRVGVLVTLSSPPGQGADQRLGVAGARVAAYRLAMGGSDVELVVTDDGGTAEGAQEAVAGLVEDGVAGIVVGSVGTHLDDALDRAAAAGVPALLPYYRYDDAPDGVWVTGPSTTAVEQGLLTALEEEGLSKPFLLTADGVRVGGVGSADSARYTGRNLRALVHRVRRAHASGAVDSVVVGGSARSQAALVGRFQGRLSDVPVLLTPEATSAVFPRELEDAEGTAAGRFITVGPDADDAGALGQGERARTLSSYFSALRLAAGDPGLTDLLDAGPFATVAADADTASHDAVVALVRAVVEAGSTEPADVAAALPGLRVTPADGLAGPALDFGARDVMAPADVVTLRATTHDPGLRPVADDVEPRLHWFAAGPS